MTSAGAGASTDNRSYLDHASASPLRPAAREAMIAWLDSADPGRVHTEGRMARFALEDAREAVATLSGTRPRQVIFTSGATEAINAAAYGASARNEQPIRVVLSAVEHSAVRDASERYAKELEWVGVDHDGLIQVDQLRHAVAGSVKPVLVHCQLANHEVGTVQPVAEIASICREYGAMLHVDAAAAAGHLNIDFDSLGADFLSLSSAKLGGPRGAGALLVRRGLRVPPFIVGGMQERARRGGLENVPAFVGFGAAASELAEPGRLAREARDASELIGRLREAALHIDGVEAFGPADPAKRLPSLLCLGMSGVEAEPVLIGLDQAGVAAHSGSSCSSESLEPSPVLEAMGVDAERSLRFSVGWSSASADIERAASVLPVVIARLRALAYPPS
ncbi:MAG TPA: cysteine desulfurase family protein [Acidimicrobiales bacterium]|nr:cysteine desulfurase family protein [Acidimicrobiales bacterium]